MGKLYTFQSGITSLALILGLTAILVVSSYSASAYPLPEGNEEGVANTTDPVWRMVAGAQTASSYMFYKQAVAYHEEPLVLINDSTALPELLDGLLVGVCDLLSVYELISRVDNSSDLYLLLTQNMIDSCNWLNYLVSNTHNVTGSNEFNLINDSCTEDSMPRLDHYCLQVKVREPDQLRHLMQRTISDGLSTYYPTSPVTEEGQCLWLESSLTIVGEAREAVQTGANLFC